MSETNIPCYGNNVFCVRYFLLCYADPATDLLHSWNFLPATLLLPPPTLTYSPFSTQPSSNMGWYRYFGMWWQNSSLYLIIARIVNAVPFHSHYTISYIVWWQDPRNFWKKVMMIMGPLQEVSTSIPRYVQFCTPSKNPPRQVGWVRILKSTKSKQINEQINKQTKNPAQTFRQWCPWRVILFTMSSLARHFSLFFGRPNMWLTDSDVSSDVTVSSNAPRADSC